MQSLSALLDMPAFGEFAQHALERRAVGILGAESLGDLARAHLTATLADEGQEFLTRGEGIACHRRFIGQEFLGQGIFWPNIPWPSVIEPRIPGLCRWPRIVVKLRCVG